jgi:uncharacterized protein
MGITSFAKLFMPKDRIFYGLFEEVTTVLSEMGELFTRSINEHDSAKRAAMLHQMEEMEHKNDEITHRIFIELGRNFITPFDREDIHSLATSLDDIADFIWGATKRISNYSIDSGDEITNAFAVVITKSIKSLTRAIMELRNMKDLRTITECCVTINSLENEGDELLDKAMMHLFTASIDPVELIKKKDIYEMLEIVTDKCEDAANVIESIIVKYA